MAKSAAKLAISLPQPLYRELEKARRASRKTRSAIVQEALQDWLGRSTRENLVRGYEAGYGAKPEIRAEVELALAAAMAAFAKDEEW
jgi:metal-responsive CopG/Arc/MetJ family transcriptional regulator